MLTPETPDTPVARTTNPTNGIRGRVLTIGAAVGFAMLSSMHRPETHAPSSTSTAAATTNERDAVDGPTEEQRVELDQAADACFSAAQSNPMVLAQVTYFMMWNPNPGTRELKQLADSMPAEVQPCLHTIARLVVLNPKEAYRLKALVGEKTGIALDCACSPSQEHEFQCIAMDYLRMSDSPHVKELSLILGNRKLEEYARRTVVTPRHKEEVAGITK